LGLQLNAQMFNYEDGSEIMVGDSVLLEHGRTPGTVELIVTTAEEMKAINVEVPGVMLKSPPFGRIYLPEWSLREDPLRLVSRAVEAQPGAGADRPPTASGRTANSLAALRSVSDPDP